MRGIALGGFMGTGKSTVGLALSRALECGFCDLDAELTRRHGPIAVQFQEVGEATFRARERACLLDLLRAPEGVLATGGGAWVDPRNRADIARVMHRVVLTASVEALRERVGSDPGRPLWDDTIASRLATRQMAYQDADLVVDTTALSPDEVVAAVLTWLSAQQRGSASGGPPPAR